MTPQDKECQEPPETGRVRERILPQSPQGAQACRYLDLGLLDSGTMREQNSIV